MAQHHGVKSAILSPETGTPEEIYALLSHMIVGNKFEKDDRFGTTVEQMKRAYEFVKKYFVVIDDVDTIHECWACVDSINQEFKEENEQTIQNLTIDPWNALSHPLNGQPRDLHLEALLTENTKAAKDRGIHSSIVTHSQNIEPIEQKGSKVMYYRKARRTQIAQGQAWDRKGQMMISLWRPPEGLWCDDLGTEYEEGYMVADLQKVKPDVSGTPGESVQYFDWRRQTYYELRDGIPYYPLKQIAYPQTNVKPDPAIQPNTEFEDEVPF